MKFRRNDFLKEHQTECNFNNNNDKNISSKNHNETNNEFVPSVTLIYNNSDQHIDFDITVKLSLLKWSIL